VRTPSSAERAYWSEQPGTTPHCVLLRVGHDKVPEQGVASVQVHPAPAFWRFRQVVRSSWEQGLAIVPPHGGRRVSSNWQPAFTQASLLKMGLQLVI
jgi:hypothetical protein